MSAAFVLVLAVLNTESSYLQEVERPAAEVPDTIQFWIAPASQWRIRTYAIDHDIHIHSLGLHTDDSAITPEEAVVHTKKHYSDIISSLIILTLQDPHNQGEIQSVLAEHKLTGTLEIGMSGVVFYNPDKGEYRSQSKPK